MAEPMLSALLANAGDIFERHGFGAMVLILAGLACGVMLSLESS